MKSSSPIEFYNHLQKAEKITIIPHKNPDGDAIGSSLGLFQFLKEQGIKSQVVCEDPVPHFIEFLPDLNEVITYESNPEKVKSIILDSQVIICMDYSHIYRCGNIAEFVKASSSYLAVIDHHPSPSDEFSFYWHDTGASSTSELVFSLIDQIKSGHDFSVETATCLYTGLLTDTGCFKYAVRPETFIAASRLIQSGIPLTKITSQIFDTNTPERIKLLGYTLDKKLVILPEYRTAYIYLNMEELKEFKARKGDTEGLVNYTLSIEGIIFGAFFYERESNITKVSLRSKGNFAVNEISSKYFNGGGHRNAAGGQVEKGVDQTVHLFRELLPQYKETLLSSNF